MKQNHKPMFKAKSYTKPYPPLSSQSSWHTHHWFRTPSSIQSRAVRFTRRGWWWFTQRTGATRSRAGATRFTLQAGAASRGSEQGRWGSSPLVNSVALSLSLKPAHSFCRGLKGSCGFVSIWFLNPFFFFFWFRECRDKLLDFFIALWREIKDEDLLAYCRHWMKKTDKRTTTHWMKNIEKRYTTRLL